MALTLVPYATEHVADVAALLDDPQVQAFVPIPLPVPDDQAQTWLDRYAAAREAGTGAAWVGLSDGEFVAYGVAPACDVVTGEGELGYMVAPVARGRGVATWVLGELTRWAFEDAGLVRVVLRVNVDNAPSQRVAERAGYVLEGVLRSTYFRPGTRVDTALWSRLATDRACVHSA